MSKVILPLELGKSQQKLFSAFVELRKEKKTEKITVVELCEKAGVNRSTFYRSYYDIFDLDEKLGEYCANAVISFCADFGYGYAEGFSDPDSVLVIPKFDNRLAVEALFVLRDERRLLENIFERLMDVTSYFIPKNFSKEDVKRFKSAYQFIVTGAILICGEVEIEKSAAVIYETSKIAFYIVKCCLEVIEEKRRLEQSPIAEDEEIGLPTKKERLNVRKTKRSLKRAFSELIKNKPIEKISVSELCEKAEVSNSTFYTHYNSIEAFVESLSESIKDTFFEIAKAIYSQLNDGQLNIKELLAYIESNQRLLNLLVSNKSFRSFDKSYPREFADTVFDMVEKDYYCPLFDARTAFTLLVYSGWGMIFEPFCENDLSTAQIFRMAYDIYLLLFKRKKTTEGSKNPDAPQN